MKNYSALKRNIIMTHATTWMNPEDIRVNEMSHTQKNKYCVVTLAAPGTIKLIQV